MGPTKKHNQNANNIDEFMISVQNSTFREGVVISVKSGEKYKLKSYKVNSLAFFHTHNPNPH